MLIPSEQFRDRNGSYCVWVRLLAFFCNIEAPPAHLKTEYNTPVQKPSTYLPFLEATTLFHVEGVVAIFGAIFDCAEAKSPKSHVLFSDYAFISFATKGLQKKGILRNF